MTPGSLLCRLAVATFGTFLLTVARVDAQTPATSSAPDSVKQWGSATPPVKKVGPPTPGKYGCTESHLNFRTGTFEYEVRGSFTLFANGTYQYPGMKSSGRYSYNPKTDSIAFKGGFFEGATATYLDRKKKLRLELPTETDRKRRWTCSLVEGK